MASLTQTAEIYFERFTYCEKQLNSQVMENLEMIVVIPCFNETDVIRSLQSLHDCDVPENTHVEVIVVVNQSEVSPEEITVRNKRTIEEIEDFQRTVAGDVSFELIEALNLPKKHAGVGLARKIGMDEALRRFAQINKDGVIVCFDADSLCEKNYFIELIKHFKKHPKTPGCSIHFEHPVAGEEYSQEIYDAIIDYELHLRYYKNALKYAGLPYAFHTIGSSMAVKASAYARQGGMNKRKAGEDFYFLNKIIELGNFTELSSTTVIPSPRISDRVPFGTGKAVGDILEGEEEGYQTYNFQSFIDLKQFCDSIFKIYKNLKASLLNKSIESFCVSNNFEKKVKEIATNTTSKEAFINRFFKVFDAFWVLKFVHYARDNFYSNNDVLSMTNALLQQINPEIDPCRNNEEALWLLRELDKK